MQIKIEPFLPGIHLLSLRKTYSSKEFKFFSRERWSNL